MEAFSKLLIILISSALGIMTLPTYADSTEAVGHIEYFNGLPESYVIKRDVKNISVGIGELVYEGDKIEVLEPNNYIILNLGEQPTKIKIVKKPTNEPFEHYSPYTVPTEKKHYTTINKTVLTNILKWASSCFTN